MIPENLPIQPEETKNRDIKLRINFLLQCERDRRGNLIAEAPPASWSNTETKVEKVWRKNPVKEGWYFDPNGINQRAENGEVPQEVIDELGITEAEDVD